MLKDITRHHVFSCMGCIYETHFPNSGHASSLLDLGRIAALELAKASTTAQFGSLIVYNVIELFVKAMFHAQGEAMRAWIRPIYRESFDVCSIARPHGAASHSISRSEAHLRVLPMSASRHHRVKDALKFGEIASGLAADSVHRVIIANANISNMVRRLSGGASARIGQRIRQFSNPISRELFSTFRGSRGLALSKLLMAWIRVNFYDAFCRSPIPAFRSLRLNARNHR